MDWQTWWTAFLFGGAIGAVFGGITVAVVGFVLGVFLQILGKSLAKRGRRMGGGDGT